MAKADLPQHVGFIPDGNRRWAVEHGMSKDRGYGFGIEPGIALFERCRELGIGEISVFCFTQDNTKRASVQKDAFTEATVAFARALSTREAAIVVVGDTKSAQFPKELVGFSRRSGTGMKVNLLVNYGWKWDLDGLAEGRLRSEEISRVDLIVRWGGGSRLSGFLPVQSVYADIYVRPELWPDYQSAHFDEALAWFKVQDRTLGG